MCLNSTIIKPHGISEMKTQKSHRNFVAKHMNDFNRSNVMKDRKKESKLSLKTKYNKKDQYGLF